MPRRHETGGSTLFESAETGPVPISECSSAYNQGTPVKQSLTIKAHYPEGTGAAESRARTRLETAAASAAFAERGSAYDVLVLDVVCLRGDRGLAASAAGIQTLPV
jgi:hypothetical protein